MADPPMKGIRIHVDSPRCSANTYSARSWDFFNHGCGGRRLGHSEDCHALKRTFFESARAKTSFARG